MISEFLDENFVFWVGELTVPLTHIEGQLAAIGVTAFPFLAMISDLGSGSIGIVGKEYVSNEKECFFRLSSVHRYHSRDFGRG